MRDTKNQARRSHIRDTQSRRKLVSKLVTRITGEKEEDFKEERKKKTGPNMPH
jgi:hypothetical protein